MIYIKIHAHIIKNYINNHENSKIYIISTYPCCYLNLYIVDLSTVLEYCMVFKKSLEIWLPSQERS